MVYVGIVSFNTLSDLPACIAAVCKQRNEDIRIIVLDNNSSDKSVVWLRKQRNITLIEKKENLGFGRAHNAIIASVNLRKGDYYLALNPDVRIDPLYVHHLVTSCRKNKADWATGKLYKDLRRKTLYSAGHALLRDGYAINVGHGEADSAYWNQGREIFGASGAAPLYSAGLIAALSRSGPFFDRRMFLYYEDVDIDWRARLLGFHCWYEPTATALHPGGGFRSRYEIEALANRYRSIFKNAMVYDLLVYNAPRMFCHIAFRIILTPQKGWELCKKVALFALVSPFERTRPKVTIKFMHSWFAWAVNQPTKQPATSRERFAMFLQMNKRS